MKVKDLIEYLQHADPEMEVRTEGCDCYGDVESVEYDYEENRCYLKRNPIDTEEESSNQTEQEDSQ